MKFLIFIFILLPLISLASEVRIFSMNLHCGLGDWKGRVDLVVDEILKDNPDVIGLQEVCFNKKMNMANYIRTRLEKGGFPVKSFQTFNTHRSFIKYQEQLLLMSRHETKEFEVGALPGPGILRNGFVTFQIGDLWFLTSHLHFALPSIRRQQFDFISKKFGSRSMIIFGDLNSNPENDETTVLKLAGWTSFFDGPTYPSNDPKKTFDGFWMTEKFHEEVMATTMERLFLNNSVQPSDHLGIKLDILFR